MDEATSLIYHDTSFLHKQALEAFSAWARRVAPTDSQADTWIEQFEASLVEDEEGSAAASEKNQAQQIFERGSGLFQHQIELYEEAPEFNEGIPELTPVYKGAAWLKVRLRTPRTKPPLVDLPTPLADDFVIEVNVPDLKWRDYSRQHFDEEYQHFSDSFHVMKILSE